MLSCGCWHGLLGKMMSSIAPRLECSESEQGLDMPMPIEDIIVGRERLGLLVDTFV